MLRHAEPNDIDSIVALECAAYNVPPIFINTNLPFMKQEWVQAIKDDKVLCLDGPEGELIGAIHVSESDAAGAGPNRTLVSLMVHPEHQNGGIGGNLLRTFLGACDREGRIAALKVDPSNRGAIHLYERHDFQPLGRESDGLLCMMRNPHTDDGQDFVF